MSKILLLVSAVVVLAEGQQKFRMQPARYTECNGALRLNSVSISAPLARKDNCRNRHLLVKKRRVQICVNATVPLDRPDLAAVLPLSGTAGLKNSAHGTLPALAPQDFCDVAIDACQGASPGCAQLVPGSTVTFCSALKVPDVPLIQPDVRVRYRTLYEANFNNQCEKSYELRRGQIPLVCFEIDTKVVNRPACPAPGLLG